MLCRWSHLILPAVLAAGAWLAWPAEAKAQYGPPQPPTTLSRFYYYPYYYYPASYWPTMTPKWPEPVGAPYMKPPAYMAYPPFHEPHWRYEAWQPQRYYRGMHFMLDQF